MNTAGQKFTVSHDSPLLKYLYEIFPTQSKTGVKNMLSKGQVLVNGERRTAFDHPLRAGDSLLILAKAVSMARESSENAREDVEKTGVKIVFEDDHYIVVDKPAGLLTVSTAKGSQSKTGKKEATLYAILNAYVKTNARARRKEDIASGRTPDRSTAKIWIVHRLDKGTSGLVVFAKNEQAKDTLQSRWKELVIERRYVAILHQGRILPGERPQEPDPRPRRRHRPSRRRRREIRRRDGPDPPARPPRGHPRVPQSDVRRSGAPEVPASRRFRQIRENRIKIES